MKLIEKVMRHHFISRVVAVVLTASLLMQLGKSGIAALNATATEGHSLLDSVSPVVYFGGMEIYDDMVIEENDLSARYTFSATRSELAGADENVILPYHLQAAGAMSETITGTDADGNILDVGTLTATEDGRVKVSFLSTLAGTDKQSTDNENAGAEEVEETDEAEEANETEETNEAEEASGTEETNETDEANGTEETKETEKANWIEVTNATEETSDTSETSNINETSADEETNETEETNDIEEMNDTGSESTDIDNIGTKDSDTDNSDTESIPDSTSAEIDPGETITVEFDIPVIIDLTNLTANKDGSYTVALESGGNMVTVTFIPQGVTDLTEIIPGTGRLGGEVINPFDPDYNVIDDSGPANITNIELRTTSGELLGNGSEISSTDSMLIYYYFKISAAQALNIKQEIDDTAGGADDYRYKITLPEGLVLPAGDLQGKNMYIDTTVGGVTYSMKYGTLYYVNSQKREVYVKFEGNFWSDPQYYENGIDYGYIWVTCLLDGDKYQGEDEVTIKLTDSVTVTLTVTDDRDPHTAVKEGEYNSATGQIDWTVVYTISEIAVPEAGFTFIDTLDGKQKYVAGSFEGILTSGNSDTDLNITDGTGLGCCDATTTSDVIKYQYDNTGSKLKKGDVITFTYSTVLKPGAYVDEKEVVVDNSIKIINNADTDVIFVEADAEPVAIPAADLELLKKEVWADGKWYGNTNIGSHSIDIDPVNHNIKWRITISTNGLSFDSGSLKFYDKISDGFSVETGSVEVVAYKADGTSYTTSIAPGLIEQATSGGYTTFSFPISVDPDVVTYVITYSTKIEEHYFADTPSVPLTNEAWIEFTIGGESLPERYRKDQLPGPGKSISVDTNILQKSGTFKSSYGGTDGYFIEWTVVVNRYGVDITEGTVTDDIRSAWNWENGNSSSYRIEGGQVYVPGSLTVTNSGGLSKTAAQWETDWYTDPYSLTLDGLGTNRFEFKFTTQVTDAALSHNGSTSSTTNPTYYLTFLNTVTFDGLVETEESHESDTGAAPITSKMVTKTGESYDYASQIITWKIKVNENKIAMSGNVTLTDILVGSTQYLEILNVDDDIIVTDSTGGVEYSKGTDYTVDYADGKLTITFPDEGGGSICSGKTVIITLKTHVNVDQTAAFKNGKTEITIDNKATLTWPGSSSGGESGTGKQKITNNMIVKEGASYDSLTNTIAYTVNVNPNRLDLSSCYLTDTLEEYLKLDVDSIELYAVDVDSAGNMITPGTLLSQSAYQWSYNYDQNSFSVYLPSAKQAYILKYSCIVVKYAAEVKNSVTLNGIGDWGSAGSAVTSAISAGSHAMINSWKEASLKLSIYKVDSQYQIAISGLKFKLYMDHSEDGTLVDAGDTGNLECMDTGVMEPDGKLTFYYLKPDREYWLVEEGGPYDDLGGTAHVIAVNGEKCDPSVPLDGFKIRLSDYEIDADNNELSITITNDPVATIKFHKVRSDNTNVFLNGAKFRLTEINPAKDSKDLYTAVVTSKTVDGVKGVVTFTDIPIDPGGSKYTLKEIAAPSNYVRSNAVYTVTVNWNRTYTIMNSKGDIVFDSTTSSELWKFKNTLASDPDPYDGSNGSDGSDDSDGVSKVIPRSWPPAPPAPYYEGDRLVPSETEENVYIEVNGDGIPVGEWRMEGNEWTFYDISSSMISMTGDNSMLPVWILCFCGSALALFVLIRKKHKKTGDTP